MNAALCKPIGNPGIRQDLYKRLKRNQSESSVPGSLPVLFFGDPCTASIVTVGLNPSWREYLDIFGNELTGKDRRFETLLSLNVPARCHLLEEQCDKAIGTMQAYFDLGKPVFGQFFRHLSNVLGAMGFSYEARQVAHLDLIQEATKPVFGDLKKDHPQEVQKLLEADTPFLNWELAAFTPNVILCNGQTVLTKVCALLGVAKPLPMDTDLHAELNDLTWYAGTVIVSGRLVGLAGWNKPLHQPIKGFGSKGEKLLGQEIKQRLITMGITFDKKANPCAEM